MVYGLGVWPVARVELADEGLMAKVLDRAFGAAGVQGAQVGGHEQWTIATDKIELVVSLREHEVIAGVFPPELAAAALAAIDKPTSNGQELGHRIAELANRHHVRDVGGPGFIDSRAMVLVGDRARSRGPLPVRGRAAARAGRSATRTWTGSRRWCRGCSSATRSSTPMASTAA